MQLKPGMHPSPGHPISPVDSPSSFLFERSIDVDEAQACPGGIFTTTGPALCGDRFPVVSITEVAP
jgi:hypothetical protein